MGRRERVMWLVAVAGIGCGIGGAGARELDAVPAGGPSSDEIRAIVAEMIADSETRSSLLQGGATAGHDGSFFVASADGVNRLNVGGHLLFRYVANFRDDDNTVDDNPGEPGVQNDDFDGGFQVRKARLRFDGSVLNPSFLYKIEANFSRDTGTAVLEDAFVGYKLNSELLLIWGNIKAPMLREELIDERYQLAAERSVANSTFTQGRSQAVAAVWTTENLQFIPVFSDGARTENTDFTSPLESDWALSGRVNWKVAGAWKQFDDFTSFRGSDFAAMLGIAGHYQQSANTNDPTDVDVDVLLYTLDAQVEGNGWNVFGAFIGRHIETRALATSDTEGDEFGAVVQGGLFLTDPDEIFGRYDVVIPDDDLSGFDTDPFHVVTIGWNRYFAGHAAKFTLDGQVALSDFTQSSPPVPSSTATGLLGSSEEGEVTIRAQFQLLF